ncbi:hypothetical protein BGZ52_010589 [Haplosporangium bisporale]|nr:hypothetical protein BGZ52_010589 [Haplosporangium bisporale]
MAALDLSSFSNKLHFYLNGTEIILNNPDPDTTLLQYVRSIGLTGSKLGCAEGGCGACTVMVSSYDKVTQHIRHLNVNACLTPLCSVDGKHVITIEGLGDHKNPHPVQERIALCYGSQCGFCTPGIAMSLYALLRNKVTPTEHEVEESFDGNLCRCTGYRPILDAAKSFAAPAKKAGGCCGGGGADGGCCKDEKPEKASTIPQESSVRFPSVLFKAYDPTQELIFPPRLMKKTAEPLHFQGRKAQWFRPTSLAQVLQIKAAYPQAKFIGGNTEVGVETKFKYLEYSPYVYLHDVAELQGIKLTSEGITIGANVTVANFQKALKDALEVVDPSQAHVLNALLANIKYFAGNQIRNAASVAGNIATASPISDLNPVFVASKSTFSILSSAQQVDSTARVVPATEFFVGYRKTALNPATDILTEIHVPLTRPGEYIRSFKQAKRKDDDIAIVTAAIRVQLAPDNTILETGFGYGGMSAFTCQAKKTSAFLAGKTWGQKDVLDRALELLDEDLPMELSTPGGMPEYRRTLAKSFFVRFWWDVIEQKKLSIIGVIVADSQVIAQEAARKVKIEYIDLPHVVTIDEAIAADSYIPLVKSIVKGDVDAAFANCAKVFEGQTRLGGQEQFYLETQAVLVNYKGESEFEIYASTQNANETQAVVASCLGVSANKVACKVKRLGGGFGGKESRTIPLSCIMSIASYHQKRPVRCMLDRNEDMAISGQRNPFMGKWKVGLDENNKLVALDTELYLNAGWSSDLSVAVMERALGHIDNVYFIPNVRAVGRCCRTNIHSNTAFRGFGGPQANVIAETYMTEIAEQIGMTQEEFREINFYKEGELTHFNQELKDWHLPKGYFQLKEKSNFDARKAAIEEFNKQSKWRKRGIALIPTKYGISFTALHLNQAGAMIHIYHDGSVLLSHGGVEMGQGLHTKMIQVCAEGLQIPLEMVHIVETSTDKVANASPTAASASSDLNGMAVKNACDQINERLEPYRAKGLPWKEIVHHAYFDRVNLSANGFYKVPDLGYKWGENKGQLFFYFTMGAAVSEVEVDLLTGAHTVIRADVNMDLGRSINPSIDIGQIEGAFIQGMGWSTTEESLYFPNGRLFTQGPGNYKIPGFQCIPQEFNISFFEDVTHESVNTVYKSKGVGEPPLFLGTSVYFAIRHALWYARQENGHPGTFALSLPATPERIRMAVGDSISESSKLQAKQGERPWVLSVF